MNSNILLSIIMPCYNVADTINRAIDSILMQRVDFLYEIIIVDDASTDTSGDIFVAYQDKHSEINILRHNINQGNARSFYDGLCASQGDFFCVLDGDDYYTIRDKLQRQIDFFRSDLNEEYVATAHYHILDLGNGQINLPATYSFSEYSYADFMTQNGGYFHTSTYMYRNIFRGNVPQYFLETLYRGDSPRTTFHLKYSHKKVKILNFVGSAYSFVYAGIWSGMNEKKQFEYQVNYLTQHKQRVATEFEKRSIDKLIQYNQNRLHSCSEKLRHYDSIDIDSAIKRLQTYAKKYAYHDLDFMLGGCYFSEYIDSACASLGYVFTVWNQMSRQTEVNPDHIAIVIGVLSPHGGGIFTEITELVGMYRQKQVFLFITNMDSIPKEAEKALLRYKHLHIVQPPQPGESAIAYFYNEMKKSAPCKAYVYASHDDTYAQALMQSGACKNICIFSFDHGYLCGISNPNYDCYIAKRPCDYTLLSKRFGEAVVYIPTWNTDAGKRKDGLRYKPFHQHKRLITASAAARYYKIDGRYPYAYFDFIVALLHETKGVHYHFGKIPEDKLALLYAKLSENRIPQKSFVYLEWADDLAGTLLEKGIDVFIEPFPVVSYKITLEVMSCGIPVIAYNGIRRMETADFLYPDALRWNACEEFVRKLSSVTVEELAAHSERAREYYVKHHAISTVLPYFMEEKSFETPPVHEVSDSSIIEIKSYGRMFNDDGRICLMDATEKAAESAVAGKAKAPSANHAMTSFWLDARRSALKAALKRWDLRLRARRETIAALRKDSIPFKLVMLLSPYTVYQKAKTAGCRIRNRFRQLQMKRHPLTGLIRDLDTHVRRVEDSVRTIADMNREVDIKMDTVSTLLNQMVETKLDQVYAQTKELTAAVMANPPMDALVKMEGLYVEESQRIEEQYSTFLSKIENGSDVAQETLWGTIFNNTIAGSSWFDGRNISASRWAAGYPFLYIIYQVLDKYKPKSILELGLGESTKLTSQYVDSHTDVEHIVIDGDRSWIDFFGKNALRIQKTQIMYLAYEMQRYQDASDVRVFSDFEAALQGKTFDLIIVDAPLGSKGEYSRVDILELLPQCLEESFIILFDDCNRAPERNTINALEGILSKNEIVYCSGRYRGTKETTIIASENLRFLCSL